LIYIKKYIIRKRLKNLQNLAKLYEKIYDFIKKKNDKLPWWIVFYLVYNIKDTSKI